MKSGERPAIPSAPHSRHGVRHGRNKLAIGRPLPMPASMIGMLDAKEIAELGVQGHGVPSGSCCRKHGAAAAPVHKP